MSHFIQERGASELSLQNSTLETTSYDDDDNVNDTDVNADINLDVDVDVDVGMESMSNVSVGSVASSFDDNAVVYEYTGSSLQLSAVEKAAVELTRLADQHGVNRQFKRDMMNTINKTLLSKISEDALNGRLINNSRYSFKMDMQ
ncbi:hypothetical protein G6F43_013532 [Rhizopus delemar]|nr:hypothetical protein G6F43_013532 [Rhizopus delemar]